MRSPVTNRDAGDEQATLFPEPTRCTARGCLAGDRKNLCNFDAEVSQGLRDPISRRPVQCLNAHPQPDAQIPF